VNSEAEAEFRCFVETRWQHLVRTAVLLTGDQGRAEDLVQQTLVIVHRKWRSIEPGATMAYARAVLANQSASWWRRRRHPEVLIASPGDELPGSAQAGRDAMAQIDARDELLRALATLPPRMRAVIVLRYYDDLSEADTAEALGISAGSVKAQASRGLDRLRTALTTLETGERIR